MRMGYFFDICYLSSILLSLFCSLFTLLFLVVFQQNPVYSVFSFMGLVGGFSVGLALVGAEFLALMVFVIYIGVIAVLFLFVIIMYNLKMVGFTFSGLGGFLFALMLGGSKFLWVCYWNLQWISGIGVFENSFVVPDICNFVALFNEHSFLLLFCGLLLFIAMIGSIVITASFTSTFKKVT